MRSRVRRQAQGPAPLTKLPPVLRPRVQATGVAKAKETQQLAPAPRWEEGPEVRGRRNQHEWGVVAQTKQPKVDYLYCELCNRFAYFSDRGYTYIKKADIPQDATMPDSDQPFWEDEGAQHEAV